MEEAIYDFTSSNNTNPVNCSTWLDIKFLKKPKLPRATTPRTPAANTPDPETPAG